MSDIESRQVLIAGAGPVGMTLALDLGKRGIDVLIVDPAASTTENPRCNTTNARSMEYFRRLGFADQIRRAGLPLEQKTDVVYMTTLTGHELTRFPFSSAQEVLDGTAPEFQEWPTPEPQHRISQIYLEPIIEEQVKNSPTIELRRGWEVLNITQEQHSAMVTIRNVDTDAEATVNAEYVVGCDGGSSTVRKTIDARLEGDATVAEERLSIYFTSDEMGEVLGENPGWMYWWYGPLHRGSFIQLDGERRYLLHSRVPAGTDPDDVDPDEVLRSAIGRDVEHEKLQVVRWTPRRLVSNKFYCGRVAVAGDAAHLWLPLGGFGMNTGIGDAVGLSWRIAALLAGHGGARLLSDYESERQSIGEVTSRAALRIDRDMTSVGRDPLLHVSSNEGDALRAEAKQLINEIDRKQFWSLGVQFGARYAQSPGVVDDGENDISDEVKIDVYKPSVSAGGRLPHTWLSEGNSLFDVLGTDWTIVDGGVPGALVGFVSAARDLGVDLTTVTLEAPVDPLFAGRIVLVRPDMIVGWSSSRAPEKPHTILARLIGHKRAEVTLPTTNQPI